MTNTIVRHVNKHSACQSLASGEIITPYAATLLLRARLFFCRPRGGGLTWHAFFAYRDMRIVTKVHHRGLGALLGLELEQLPDGRHVAAHQPPFGARERTHAQVHRVRVAVVDVVVAVVVVVVVVVVVMAVLPVMVMMVVVVMAVLPMMVMVPLVFVMAMVSMMSMVVVVFVVRMVRVLLVVRVRAVSFASAAAAAVAVVAVMVVGVVDRHDSDDSC